MNTSSILSNTTLKIIDAAHLGYEHSFLYGAISAAIRTAAEDIIESSPEWMGSEGAVWYKQKLHFIADEIDNYTNEI